MSEKEWQARAQKWLEPNFDQATRQEVEQLLKQGGDALADAFYQDLNFGTGGMRGIMGAGTNRINRYTLGMASLGLSRYLKKAFPAEAEELKVAIAYDSRHNSQRLAQDVASVLAAERITVFLYEELRPTPALSFAIRHLNCHSGIVITASHNPPEYNGYKVYWRDGGQLVPPHDTGVIEEVRKVKPAEVRFAENKDYIVPIGQAVDEAFLAEVEKQSLRSEGKEELSVVFTSIHGTSITLLPPALARAGFKTVHVVEEQAQPNGDFPTVESPNPEEGAALQMALDLAEQKNADLVIGTDPDADRVGIAARNGNGEMVLLNGNQAAVLLIDYLLEAYQAQGRLQSNHFIGKTIVTTDLLARLADAYGVPCYECLTGFKWIADMIREKEGKEVFLAGGEESYGYMVGDFVRDKDAVTSAVMLAEAAAYAKSKGQSLLDRLSEIYLKHGLYQERLISLVRKGKKGAEEIAQMMEDFRSQAPESIAGEKVIEIADYQKGLRHNRLSNESGTIDLPRSNVVQLKTDRGTLITARPSGTEPKIKFYISANAPLASREAEASVLADLNQRIEAIAKALGL